MKKVSLFVMLGWLVTLNSYANGCWNLDVVIKNQTGHQCQLVTSNIEQGQLAGGLIPSTIENGQQTYPFSIEQTYTQGPKVSLQYQCKNKTITITSQQGLCVLFAGPVIGTFQSSNNVRANLTPTSGSWWYSNSGNAHWTLY